MRRHTQEKPYICDFPGCGKAFAITGALTIHKRTHNGDKPFKCKYCDRAFAESSNLSKHLRTHTGIRPYACTEPGCDKRFSRPDQVTRHMSVHRKKDKDKQPSEEKDDEEMDTDAEG
ncbi:Zinc finger protein ZIC 5 [Ceratobasidium sp. 428]|nr:Zinc finger protein ZIC 5 [Ceratobasidium sp. 428]